ncbi:hypothetical protein [Haloferax sulfurifontis]|uniref:Uncharacterized protein n=2 Tax=Haloferax sulfurifontis TaxID=255616 RepID=M0HZI2_9EURY|nr:hypothetical protein [Haloferax sulfurifontis]ELZ89896.1 hypothetical protein C441_14521 [Haloferax sulfurifontis ATCC BAA-897]GGC63036.1 hypothetical protein GCM10007209_26480 [Haloferax sulfurifontis]
MPSTDSGTELWSAVQRAILGGLLAIVAILGFGWTRQLGTGNLLVGSFGLLLFVGAGYWILSLFRMGLDE